MNAQGTVAEGGDGVHVVADDDHCRLPTDHLPDARLAFSTESRVAHRHDLVDEQDLWFKMGGHSEPKSGFHAHGIGPDGLVDVVTKFAERDDVLHALGHLVVGQPEDAAVEFDVLPAAEVALESRADAGKQNASPTGADGAGIGAVDACNQAQDGRFPGSVRSDDAKDLTTFHVEVDLVEGSEAASPAVLAKASRHLLLEVGRRSTFDREVEGDILELNHADGLTSQMFDGFRLSPDKDDASQKQDDEAHQHCASNPFEFEQGRVAGHGRA